LFPYVEGLVDRTTWRFSGAGLVLTTQPGFARAGDRLEAVLAAHARPSEQDGSVTVRWLASGPVPATAWTMRGETEAFLVDVVGGSGDGGYLLLTLACVEGALRDPLFPVAERLRATLRPGVLSQVPPALPAERWRTVFGFEFAVPETMAAPEEYRFTSQESAAELFVWVLAPGDAATPWTRHLRPARWARAPGAYGADATWTEGSAPCALQWERQVGGARLIALLVGEGWERVAARAGALIDGTELV
jgi:hypothetical protein